MSATSFGTVNAIPANEEGQIKDVWNHNLHAEFRVIRQACIYNLNG